MSNDSRYFKLGLFVIVGVALLVGGVILFGAGALLTDYVAVETATTESVQGLDVGSSVKYMGVEIGKISKIEMASWRYHDPDPAKQNDIGRFILIEMSIRRDMVPAHRLGAMQRNLDRMVEQGFRVRMASSGLTGPAYLEAAYVDPANHPPLKLPWRPDGLYVPSTPSSMTQIVRSIEDVLVQIRRADIGKVIGHVDDLIVNADAAVSELKVAMLREKAAALIDEVRGSNRRVKEILDNPRIDKAVHDLSDAVAGGKEIIASPEVKAVIADLPRISAHMRQTMERVEQIVHDPKLQNAIDGLSDTAASAAPAAADLRRLLRQLDQLVTTQRQDVEAIVINLRRVLENGSALVEDAKNNPSRAIFGDPPPRVQIGGGK